MVATVVNHLTYDDPGHIRTYLESRSMRWEMLYRELYLETPMPLTSDCELLVLLGSTWNPSEPNHPGVKAELDLIERANARSVPILGVCYGAELLALAAGARLFTLSEPCVGFREVHMSGPYTTPWHVANSRQFFWNHLGFELPSGARLLSEGPESCWAYDDHGVLALQFHVDATPELLERWTDEGSQELSDLGVSRSEIVREAADERGRVSQVCARLMDTLLASAR